MSTGNVIAAISAIISLGAFFYSWLIYRQSQHSDIIRALQGEKEAVGYMAFTMSQRPLPWGRRHREEILRSLCLAAVFEASDRSRALIYDALRRHSDSHRADLVRIVGEVSERFGQASQLLDLERGNKRLNLLRTALGMSLVEGGGPASA